jgi:hypothetical protein
VLVPSGPGRARYGEGRTLYRPEDDVAREDWTVDRLHHALPHSVLRQQLLADVNLTPIDELPVVLERWAAAVETLQDAGRRIDTARAAQAPGRPLLDGLVIEDRTADVHRDAGPRHDTTGTQTARPRRDEHGRGAA